MFLIYAYVVHAVCTYVLVLCMYVVSVRCHPLLLSSLISSSRPAALSCAMFAPIGLVATNIDRVYSQVHGTSKETHSSQQFTFLLLGRLSLVLRLERVLRRIPLVWNCIGVEVHWCRVAIVWNCIGGCVSSPVMCTVHITASGSFPLLICFS